MIFHRKWSDCDMEVILIANGLTGLGEHSHRLVREVSRALSSRNVRHQAYAAKSLDPSVADEKLARPHFKRSLYDQVGLVFPKLQSRTFRALWDADKLTRFAHTEFLTWKILNHSFRRDLEALPNDACTAENLVVITAISQNQLSGLVDFLLARPPDLQPRVVCQLMFTPTWTPWGRPAHFGDAYYRMAFNRAGPLIGRKLFSRPKTKRLRESIATITALRLNFFQLRSVPRNHNGRLRKPFVSDSSAIRSARRVFSFYRRS